MLDKALTQLVIDILYLSLFLGNLLCLQLQNAHIALIYHCGIEDILALKRLFMENFHREFYHLFTSCRVDKRCILHAIFYILYAHLLQGINANDKRNFTIKLHCSFVRTSCHWVVHCKHKVDMGVLLEDLLHLCFSIGLKEVSPSFGYYLHFGGVFEGIYKAFMTLGIGGRAFGTTYFGYIAFAFENAYCIKPCFFAYLVIIGSHIGCITLGSDFSIDQNHGNTLLVSLFNNWGTGFRLVR